MELPGLDLTLASFEIQPTDVGYPNRHMEPRWPYITVQCRACGVVMDELRIHLRTATQRASGHQLADHGAALRGIAHVIVTAIDTTPPSGPRPATRSTVVRANVDDGRARGWRCRCGAPGVKLSGQKLVQRLVDAEMQRPAGPRGDGGTVAVYVGARR